MKNHEYRLSNIRYLTSALVNGRTYDPRVWSRRAANFLKLGYPDLATGDAIKALTLIRRINSDADLDEIGIQTWNIIKHAWATPSVPNPTREQVRDFALPMEGIILLTLAQALFLCNCFTECIQAIKEYQREDNPFADSIEVISMLAVICQRIKNEEYAVTGDVNNKEDVSDR